MPNLLLPIVLPAPLPIPYHSGLLGIRRLWVYKGGGGEEKEVVMPLAPVQPRGDVDGKRFFFFLKRNLFDGKKEIGGCGGGCLRLSFSRLSLTNLS